MKNTIKTRLSYIIEIPKIKDEAYLCFLEEKAHIPFAIKRIYYVFDVFKNAVRGKHAHKKTLQVLFCIKGNVTITLDNGKDKETITLNKPNQGIYLDAMVWHEMKSFKEGTILLVIASEKYEAKDYIRKYTTFIKLLKKEQ